MTGNIEKNEEGQCLRIWVDADACPGAVKEILYRAAERAKVTVTLVANQALRTPPSRYIKSIRVAAGLDVADKAIVDKVRPGDLVITADIPMAARVIAQGGHVIDPRGELYTRDTISERLSMRNFMDELRGSGVETGGPASFRQGDRQAFANQLDRFLSRHGPAPAHRP